MCRPQVSQDQRPQVVQLRPQLQTAQGMRPHLQYARVVRQPVVQLSQQSGQHGGLECLTPQGVQASGPQLPSPATTSVRPQGLKQSNPYATARPTGVIYKPPTQSGQQAPNPTSQNTQRHETTLSKPLPLTATVSGETKTGDEFETPPSTPPTRPQSCSLEAPPRLVAPASCPPARKVLPGITSPRDGSSSHELGSGQMTSSSERKADDVLPSASLSGGGRKGSSHSLGAEPLSRRKSDTNLDKRHKDGKTKDGECDIM